MFSTINPNSLSDYQLLVELTEIEKKFQRFPKCIRLLSNVDRKNWIRSSAARYKLLTDTMKQRMYNQMLAR